MAVFISHTYHLSLVPCVVCRICYAWEHKVADYVHEFGRSFCRDLDRESETPL